MGRKGYYEGRMHLRRWGVYIRFYYECTREHRSDANMLSIWMRRCSCAVKCPFFSGVCDRYCEPPVKLSNANECYVTIENAAIYNVHCWFDGIQFVYPHESLVGIICYSTMVAMIMKKRGSQLTHPNLMFNTARLRSNTALRERSNLPLRAKPCSTIIQHFY